MKQKNQYWWMVFLGLIGLSVVWQFYPLPDARARLQSIPAGGIGFGSRTVELRPEERKILARARVVRREYQFEEESFQLTVIDGTHDRHAVHDPLYCIRGSGWEVVSANLFPLRGGEARLLRLRKGTSETEALIWFSDGRSRYASAARYWWETTVRRLTLGASGAEPILVRLQTVRNGIVNWRRLVEEFPPLFDL